MSKLASFKSAQISPRTLRDGRISKLQDLYEAASDVNFTPGWVPRTNPILRAEPRPVACRGTLDVPRRQGGPRCGRPADRRLAGGAPQPGYAKSRPRHQLRNHPDISMRLSNDPAW